MHCMVSSFGTDRGIRTLKARIGASHLLRSSAPLSLSASSDHDQQATERHEHEQLRAARDKLAASMDTGIQVVVSWLEYCQRLREADFPRPSVPYNYLGDIFISLVV